MRVIAAYIRSHRGQALVEFALVLPVLILVIMGMMEFGLVIHQVTVANEAARAGARVAAVGGDDTAINAAITTAAPTLKLTNQQVTITPAARVVGSPVTVIIQGKVTTITPLIGGILGDLYSVKGTAVMRVEVAGGQ